MIERKNKYCKIPESIIDECIDLFNNGMSITKIAQQYNLNRQNLSKRLKEKGCKVIQHNNKKQVNSDYFSNITEESAY